MDNHYELLGVDPSASQEDIKRAFRALALKYHPDQHPSAIADTVFRRIKEAYDVLSDPARRMTYDASIGVTAGPRSAAAQGLRECPECSGYYSDTGRGCPYCRGALSRRDVNKPGADRKPGERGSRVRGAILLSLILGAIAVIGAVVDPKSGRSRTHSTGNQWGPDSSKAATPSAVPAATGTMTISSFPPGAKAYVCAKDEEHTTPVVLTFRNVQAGGCPVWMSKAGFQAFESTVAIADGTVFTAELAPSHLEFRNPLDDLNELGLQEALQMDLQSYSSAARHSPALSTGCAAIQGVRIWCRFHSGAAQTRVLAAKGIPFGCAQFCVNVFHDGAKDGAYRAWHTNGSPMAVGQFRRALPSGQWAFWYPNGQKMAEGRFAMGVRRGRWSFWDPAGKPTRRARPDVPEPKSPTL